MYDVYVWKWSVNGMCLKVTGFGRLVLVFGVVTTLKCMALVLHEIFEGERAVLWLHLNGTDVCGVYTALWSVQRTPVDCSLVKEH